MPLQVVCCSAKVPPHNSEMEHHPRICLVSQWNVNNHLRAQSLISARPVNKFTPISPIKYNSSDTSHQMLQRLQEYQGHWQAYYHFGQIYSSFFFKRLHSLRTQAPPVDVQSFPKGIRVRKLPYFGSSIMAQSTVTGGGGTTPLDPVKL